MTGVILALFAMGAAFLLINLDSAASLDPNSISLDTTVDHYMQCRVLRFFPKLNSDNKFKEKKICYPETDFNFSFCHRANE